MSFAERLKAILAEKEVSQSKLAGQLGITSQAVNQWANGSTEPDFSRIQEIASALGVSPSDLLPDRDTSLSDKTDSRTKSPLHERGERAINRAGDLVVEEVAQRSFARELTLSAAEQRKRSVVGKWTMPYDMVQSHVLPDANLIVLRVQGDSMEPDYNSGDRVLIDKSATTPSPPGVYVLWDGLGYILKRLELLLGGGDPVVRVSSSNPAYTTYERPLDALPISGRVVGKWMWK